MNERASLLCRIFKTINNMFNPRVSINMKIISRCDSINDNKVISSKTWINKIVYICNLSLQYLSFFNMKFYPGSSNNIFCQNKQKKIILSFQNVNAFQWRYYRFSALFSIFKQKTFYFSLVSHHYCCCP